VTQDFSSAGSAIQKSMQLAAEQRSNRHPTEKARTYKNPERSLIALAILLGVALIVGGGGVRYGLANLVVQLTALALLACYREAFFSYWKKAPASLNILVALSIALPVLHLVPLPESVWTQLPGRSLAADAREASGYHGWASASLDHSRTLVALSGLIAPLTVLVLGWTVVREHLAMLGLIVVAMGVMNFLLGIPQILSTDTLTSFYPETPMPGVLFGTFANRNSTGVFLVCALAFAAVLPVKFNHPMVLPIRVCICILLVTAIVLTRSRTALVLASLPFGLVGLKAVYALIIDKSSAAETGRGRYIIGMSVLFAGAVTAAILLAAPGRVSDTLERFEGDANPRAYIWEDSLYVGDRYWPVGAGMGTFDEVFQIDESLENMAARRPGRAHNDYIEIAIEAGVPGLALIAAWLVLIGWFTWKARLSAFRWEAWCGSVVLFACALQSVTDYPLRNQSMLVLAAFALVLLARAQPGFSADDAGTTRRERTPS